MFNKAIIPALLVGGLGIAVAGCEALYKDRNLLAASEPKKALVIFRGDNKPQTRAEELDKYCADKTEGFISAHVEFRGQRLTCKQYLTLRAQGWSQTATQGPGGAISGKTFSVEEIIRLKKAGVSDEVILKLAGEWYPKKEKRSRQGAAVLPRAPFDGYWSGKLNCFNRPWWTLRHVMIWDGKLVIKKEPTQQQAALDISGEFDSEGRIKLKGRADNSAGISQHLWIQAKGKGDRIEGWGMLDAADCVFSVGRD